MSDVTHLLEAACQGDPKAADQLLPLVWPGRVGGRDRSAGSGERAVGDGHGKQIGPAHEVAPRSGCIKEGRAQRVVAVGGRAAFGQPPLVAEGRAEGVGRDQG